MAELKGKKRKQSSSCPDGWLAASIVVQLEFTRRQERYAQRCVGTAIFVYNRMVGNDQAGRDAELWVAPHELEKEFNAAKHVNPALSFVTEVSMFVAQGACRSYRKARSRWLNKELKALRPVFHKKNRTGAASFLAASGMKLIQYNGHRRIRLPYLGGVRMTRSIPEGISHKVTIRKRNGRWYARIACWKPPVAPPREKPNRWAALTWASVRWRWTAAVSIPILMHTSSPSTPLAVSGSSPTPEATAMRSKRSAASSVPNLYARPAAGAGGKPNAVLTVPTCGPRACGTTLIIT